MPEGIIATVDGGYATLDFTDKSKRGPALAALIESGGPGIVETISRSGPRRKYRVPEGNARELGLIDDETEGAVYSAGHDTGSAARLSESDPQAGLDGGDVSRPVAPTSANAFVGQTSAADERALALPPQQVEDAVSEGFGGLNASETTVHVDTIAHVLDGSSVRAVGGVQPVVTPDAEKDHSHPGAAANLGLADQFSGNPHQETTYVEAGASVGDYTPNPTVQDVTATQGAVAVADPVETHDHAPGELVEEPSIDWTREALNDYASKHGVDNPEALPKKQAVLDAINDAKAKA